MENKLKHLEFIQGVISRMSQNSFLLKAWSVTLIVALFALSAPGTNSKYIFVVYFPVIILWVLDGYFLLQEWLFRDLYDDVRRFDESDIDFSMHTKKYKMNKGNNWLCAMFSTTLIPFYLTLIVAMLVIMKL